MRDYIDKKRKKIAAGLSALLLAGLLTLSGCAGKNLDALTQKNTSSQQNISSQADNSGASENGESQISQTDKAYDLKTGGENISSSLTWKSRMQLSYASGFSVDTYEDKHENQYELISISDGSRFLVVSENAEVPDDVSKSIKILKQPVKQIYLVATATMDMFRTLGALEDIRFSGTDVSGWYIPEAKAKMENGDILYAGKYSEPDYERIVSEGCNLAIENTMILHSPEVREKLESFGIPVLVDHSSYEEHPLGRTEWIRLYGVITGKEEDAEEAFAEQKAALERVSKEISGENSGQSGMKGGQIVTEDGQGSTESTQSVTEDRPTVAFFYITNQGSVNVRRSTDYIPKMIELAGGKYIFEHLGEDGKHSSTINMQMEEFYAGAKDADYLIYNSTIDGELKSVSELLEKAPVLKDFKAVKSGNVWCTTKNLYQESMSVGPMLEDIYSIFNGSNEDGKYLYQLK